ncbi:MAG: bifunctional phosphoribosylaminoimidazolecarboxamide formyltransferase/IMP cyclohydrolase [Actinomycetota bacterium]|nr:bifunctional phosphoribosylaminoimidazolecarboxamide formyltransferase/IMP cyclohydrolase [Actinomycetota bacterium]
MKGIALKALLSVYKKDGIVEFARGLIELGFEIIASGGTSIALDEANVSHVKVEDVTGFPEMLDGRVKTLHPKIHGGILANRDLQSHFKDLESAQIDTIDLVACNLYPFEENPGIETIDVGGPTMVRAAAKNHKHVFVVVDPKDYDEVLNQIGAGVDDYEYKKKLAAKAFSHLSRYDSLIANWLSDDQFPPARMTLSLEKSKSLRYGENPHQVGALYKIAGKTSWLDSMQLLSGIELSYLNIYDADAAWRLVHEFSDEPTVAIIKHANPSGFSISSSAAESYRRAFDCDPVSAFGGIVAINRVVDLELAEAIVANPKADVVIAYGYSSEALALLSTKRKNTRFVQAEAPDAIEVQIRTLGGAALVQESDRFVSEMPSWRVVTSPNSMELNWKDIEVAWKVCARTSSNAIVIAKDRMAIGIGAGQQNRLDSSRIAIEKAGESVRGAVAASDAFFPFPDGMLTLANAGISTIVSPGGSINDEKVIEAANEVGVTLIFTGERHFKH